jgi:hypothetical protein
MDMPKVPPTTKGGGDNGHCPHHWLIEEARGEYSVGVCRLCGVTEPFRNWVPGIQMIGGDIEKSRIGGNRKNGGADSYAYIPVLHELEGTIY